MIFMNQATHAMWAKKSDADGLYEWLSLRQHSRDVTYIIAKLWKNWLSISQRIYIIDQMPSKNEQEAINLAKFLGMTHDLGKATPAFQARRSYFQSDDLDDAMLEHLELAGFRDLSHKTTVNFKESPHALASEYLLHSYGVGSDIASIIGGHHGRPVDSPSTVKRQAYQEGNYWQDEDPSSTVHQLWKSVQADLFQEALDVSGFQSVDELPTLPKTAQVLYSGLLIMADWIGSNENHFPLLALGDHIYEDSERLVAGWQAWYKNNPLQTEDQSFITLYKERMGFTPRSVQALMGDTIENAEDGGLFILEAPMGIGKTEAALIGAEQLMAKKGLAGLFFGLPTQAMSNGIFPRIKQWLSSLSEEYGQATIRLSHGKAALNESFTSLPPTKQVSGNESGSVSVNQWFGGRKTAALDDFVVGTVDQLLMVALKQNHLAMRHLGFTRKVVILDEVHAYDAYMSEYLMQALMWLGAYNIPVIILSATLPKDKRLEMIQSYLIGKGAKKKDITLPDHYVEDAYPSITYTDGHTMDQVVDTANEQENDKEVHIKQIQERDLVDQICSFMEDDGNIGIIVNTVKRSQELARVLSEILGKDQVLLLHSGFIATDRQRKEEQLLQMVGKGANRPKKKVIIGTQVIEQSLDIDFDVLFTDPAPMDLVIQRIGRLHRHDIERPSNHREPITYLIRNDEEMFDKGSQFIYGNYLLAKTMYFLEDTIKLPSDISPLVQTVYNEEPLTDGSPETEYIEQQKDEHRLRLRTQRKKAKQYQVGKPTGRTLHKWLNAADPNQSDESVQAQVRDIDPTIEVIALKQVDDGYGTFNDNENIAEKIEDWGVAKDISRETIVLPRHFAYPSRFDNTIRFLENYNAEHLPIWQQQVWLRGSLGIVFDEKNQFKTPYGTLHYDRTYGLILERND